MEFGSKKQKGLGKSIGQRDRLSELPDEVLVHILSFLPTSDAVKTVLLRRFGDLWTMVHTLRFNGFDFIDGHEVLFSRFACFVHNVLILHKRPTIDKFCVKVITNGPEQDWQVAQVGLEVWMRFVLSKKAKTLMIDCSNHRAYFNVPSSICMSQSLVRLTLQHCVIELILSKVHMGSLRTLELDHVNIDGDFDRFVSGCPCLQEVVLRETKRFRILSFSSPNIEKLGIWEEKPWKSTKWKPTKWKIDCPNLKILDLNVYLDNVEVINVPSVRELKVGNFRCYIGKRFGEEQANQFKRFVEGCQNVEVLTLTQLALPQFTCLIKNNVGFPRNRWKRVIVKSPIHNSNIAGICSLVRNSPCLEELIITVDQGEAVRCSLLEDSDLSTEVAFSPCVVPHLKLVSMHGYGNPYEVQLGLVKFLLKSAVNLEKLIFSNERSQLTSVEGQQFVNQMSNFSRASTKARIMFE